MSTDFNNSSEVNEEKREESGEFVYRKVMKKDEKKRNWSVFALALAILSLCFVLIPWVSFVMSALSIGSAVVSRIKLGYFDKITLTALIIAIFGIVFSLTGILFGDILASIFA